MFDRPDYPPRPPTLEPPRRRWSDLRALAAVYRLVPLMEPQDGRQLEAAIWRRLDEQPDDLRAALIDAMKLVAAKINWPDFPNGRPRTQWSHWDPDPDRPPPEPPQRPRRPLPGRSPSDGRSVGFPRVSDRPTDRPMVGRKEAALV